MTLARKVLWESSQHGGVPRGLMNHVLPARTVEEVCFLQHIFARIVDKVSRNWLMDIFKYTQCILHDKLHVWRTREKSEPQMGFEPTTLTVLYGEKKKKYQGIKHHRITQGVKQNNFVPLVPF